MRGWGCKKSSAGRWFYEEKVWKVSQKGKTRNVSKP